MDLDACYFCGAAEDVSRFAVVPPRFAPDEDDQRGVVLCPTCRGKLKRVMEPVVAAADGAEDLRLRERRRRRRSGDGSASDDGEAPEGVSADRLDAEREAARNALTAGEGKPEGYGRLVRLLENRRFPVRRGDIQELAKDAYGIAPEQVEKILDAAIEEGRFTPDEQEPDVLYRT